MRQYGVIWCSAGCLPDSDEFEFVGSYEECAQWARTAELPEELPEHNLYQFEIVGPIEKGE